LEPGPLDREFSNLDWDFRPDGFWWHQEKTINFLLNFVLLDELLDESNGCCCRFNCCLSSLIFDNVSSGNLISSRGEIYLSTLCAIEKHKIYSSQNEH